MVLSERQYLNQGKLEAVQSTWIEGRRKPSGLGDASMTERPRDLDSRLAAQIDP